MKEFVIEPTTEGRVFPIQNGSILVEYRGKTPKDPLHLVDKESYDKLQSALDVMSQIIQETQKIIGIMDSLLLSKGINFDFQEALFKADKIINKRENEK